MIEHKGHVRERRSSGARGFSLIELLIILLLIGILALFGMPALLNTVQRAKITGAAQQVATVMRAARLEAIKRSVSVDVVVDFKARTVWSHALYADGTDVTVSRMTLPTGVSFQGPGAAGTANVNAISGLTTNGTGGTATFRADGSVVASGAIRLRDLRDNILEARVEPQATARIFIRKFAGDPSGTDDPAQYFEPGEGAGWSWR